MIEISEAIFSRAVLRPRSSIHSRAASSSSSVISSRRCAICGVVVISSSKGFLRKQHITTSVVAVTSKAAVGRPGRPTKSDGSSSPTIWRRPSSIVWVSVAMPETTEPTKSIRSPDQMIVCPA
jgi:hypothetical protein